MVMNFNQILEFPTLLCNYFHNFIITAEISFSSLQQLENYIIIKERLNGLVVLNIHEEIPKDINKIINRFLRKMQKQLKIEDRLKENFSVLS